MQEASIDIDEESERPSALAPGFLRLVLRAAAVTVAVALAARVTVPLVDAVAPFTLQTLAVLVAGPLAGKRSGSLGIALYLLLGGLGAPLFAGGASGWAVLFGPSAGFLWAFLAVAPLIGLARKRFDADDTGAWFVVFLVGHMVILAVGFAWLLILGKLPDPLAAALPMLPGMLLKTMLATAVVHFALPVVRRRRDPRRRPRGA
ncbi:MAG TPA: biotin transporter BioY [Pseudomonadales bacterium]|nr:biotin transporter BioY [Pseudomonadales bacterium]